MVLRLIEVELNGGGNSLDSRKTDFKVRRSPLAVACEKFKILFSLLNNLCSMD